MPHNGPASDWQDAPEPSVTTSTELGDWVRAMRTRQGVSQRALADRSGLSRSYLCDIERGRGAKPSVATLDKLAIALGASRTDLLRVAGILEAAVGRSGDDRERRMVTVFRDLSPEGKESVERFIRFLHAEENRWSQPGLLDDVELDQAPVRVTGPTLFDAAGSGESLGG